MIDINKRRMVATFLELIKFYSPSLKEKDIADHLAIVLRELGCKVSFDNAGKRINGNCGNLYAKFPGTVKSKPLLLCSHMDSVEPCKNIKPIIKKDRITSDGKTILGADAKSGLAVILEVLRILDEQRDKLKFPPLEIFFSVAEEIGMHGSLNMDISKIKSKEGISLDFKSPHEPWVQGPAKYNIYVKVRGKAAHAAVDPEKGISAVVVASKAIAKMKLGRIDKDTTANLTIVKGNIATNIVTQEVRIGGEVRSYTLSKLKKQANYIKNIFEQTAKKCCKKIDGKWICPKIEFKTKLNYSTFNIKPNVPIMKVLKKAIESQGLKMKPIKVNAGSDSTILFSHGINAPVMGCGERGFHTEQAWLCLKDFYNSAKIVLSVVLNYRR
jgi:tripeptide aminopeptidase